MNKYAIELHNVTKSFSSFHLQNISFSLPTGYIMGLVGENGAGKTTVIKLMLELLKKDKGDISLLGKDIYSNFTIKQDIAVVFDDIFFVEDWKLHDVESAISPFYTNWDRVLFQHYCTKFHLDHNVKVKELSKGMKMKLMIAVALSHKARLLILDEPTSGLDPVARDELLNILQQFIEDEQNSVLFSTHITADINKIADYITVLHEGKIFFTGSKDELLETYAIVKGGNDEVNDTLLPHLIGLRKSQTGFSALFPVCKMNVITPNLIVEEVTIDEVLIYLNESGD